MNSTLLGIDAIRYPDAIALRRIVNHHSKDALIDIALRWLDIYDITRVGGIAADNEDDSDDDQFNDYMLDNEDWQASVRRMTPEQYKAHVAKRYEDMREKASKRRVVDRMLNVDWSRGLNARQIAELDLTYYSEQPSLKNWRAMKLIFGEEGAQDRTKIDPQKIRKTLSHFLSPFIKHHAQVLQKQNMVWIRISVHDGLAPHVLPTSMNVVYFIWFKDSEYLLGSQMKVEWRDFILEALLRLFKAVEMEDWPLTGKSPTSLSELLLNKDSQGSHSRYRLHQLDDNPLSSGPKKRKIEDLHQKYTKGMRDIHAEDLNKIATRERFVATEFGPNSQPSLQKVELQLNLPYTTESKEFSLGRITRQPFPIKIVLEGSNVIEGIRSLIPLGVAQNPMPRFLTELHSMATNSITVEADEQESSGQRITPTSAP
ncbi:hypothetical protein BGZ99_009969 [Dissophora globulifera]|uniref:Centromere protein Chl4/mis15/CENP-N n=1 Tax=Dissophora globulifera TaxID=979702 RepID=A0A9P6RUW8_9FUNG|nr:hypothetical protein BGZ99_009969 [Dissophora globulifera]